MSDATERLRFDCPHCDSLMKIRTSKRLAPTYRKLYLYCTNQNECGFRCTADIEITTTLTPPALPNPNAPNIPLDASLLKSLELVSD